MPPAFEPTSRFELLTCSLPCLPAKPEPMTGFEPVTYSLPWSCSTS